MQKILPLVLAAAVFATAMNSTAQAAPHQGPRAMKEGLKNGPKDGMKHGLKYGLKDGAKEGLKNGLKKGMKNGKKYDRTIPLDRALQTEQALRSNPRNNVKLRILPQMQHIDSCLSGYDTAAWKWAFSPTNRKKRREEK